ncbi:MAG: NAD(P)H-hydrate dehydratase, partial [bacterium]|nr:NAD(P)H-hydrate dehydratase [bacterium]
PRPPGGHKGTFGHALVVGGARGKTGAAARTGMAALRAGAGLVTVASAESAIGVIASHAPEMMTAALPETDAGSVSARALDDNRIASVVAGKTVLAIGPGLGTEAETFSFVRRVIDEFDVPMVVDADGLNALAGESFRGRESLILTPHPGEMARLSGLSTKEILDDRVSAARTFAMEKQVCLVLKGQRTLVALPGGRVWINPTGTPALATGGTGDILTGMVAGLVAQFPDEREAAVLAAVYLHGLAGELGAGEMGEQVLTATDVLRFLPRAIEEARGDAD